MTSAKKRIAFKTLGCRLNQYETDALVSDFDKAGYEIVDFREKADVVVVNTCTVTNQSDQKSRNIINQAARNNQGSMVVVTGCMANNYKETLESEEKITYVVENNRKGSILNLVDAHFAASCSIRRNCRPMCFSFMPSTKVCTPAALSRFRTAAITFVRSASYRQSADVP
jgi:threonylcarbamoyladenosine tRNA methylthiotransferase MtaB